MKKGMTLVELLCVLAIIGIFSSIILAFIADVRENGIDRKELIEAIIICEDGGGEFYDMESGIVCVFMDNHYYWEKKTEISEKREWVKTEKYSFE